jgi:hypothetical protein
MAFGKEDNSRSLVTGIDRNSLVFAMSSVVDEKISVHRMNADRTCTH